MRIACLILITVRLYLYANPLFPRYRLKGVTMRVVKTAVSMYPETWEKLDQFAHEQHMNRSAATEVLLQFAFELMQE